MLNKEELNIDYGKGNSMQTEFNVDLTNVYEVIEDITELLEEKYNYVLKIDDIENGKIIIDLVDFIELKKER